jgi:hypothetical protein
VPAVKKNRQSAPAGVAPAAKFFIVHRSLIFLFSQAAGDIQSNIKKILLICYSSSIAIIANSPSLLAALPNNNLH